MQAFTNGEKVYLRDRIEADVDRWISWQTHGEWLAYDAPWEPGGEQLSPAQEEEIRSNFLKAANQKQPTPRTNGMIVSWKENQIIGYVVCYGSERFPDIYYTGINICEDAYLNLGLGSEALRLWVDYLFEHSNAHKIECHTWSLNPRMMRVAEKLGFLLEGSERELVEWQGIRHDRARYGLLRREWEARTIK